MVVIVSAMAGETNRLLALARQVNDDPDDRELDVIAATGEQVSIGLLAIALQQLGLKARSYTGFQVRILTDGAHTKARILSIDDANIRADLASGHVVVVAGFQGIDERGNITTLGRGGSDTTGVALAAALKADECQIYTDVDGVYTTDPRITPKAHRLSKISFEEMLEMASLGAKVLQVRSVELAMVHGVRTLVRSSFDDPDAPPAAKESAAGTLICDEDEIVEKQLVTGIAYSKDEAKITLRRVEDKPGVAAAIFGPLAEAGINVDMIVQNISEDGLKTDLTFTVARADYERAMAFMADLKANVGYEGVTGSSDVAKVSVIGIGMRSHAGVAAQAFRALASRGINIQLITTSEIKISVLIDEAYTELAVRTLHSIYDLDKT